MNLQWFWTEILKHILDVLLVAYLIYRLLLLAKGTRATQLLIGIVLLAVATLVAQAALKLELTGWLLSNFWAAAAVILVVVFQPELRSALAQLGSRRWAKFLVPQELTFLDELLAALREASEREIGMLIALEGETGLRNFTETGTVIQGEVSRELLISIFYPRSPLHDGAVIMQGPRILAAGCLLPLSNDPELARLLGTRHRAAVGLSEISDALVVVVSEETGVISLAQGGRLERNLDADELRERLRAFYRARPAALERAGVHA